MLPRLQSLAITFWRILELIRHLHIHNAPYLPPQKCCISIVFSLSWDSCNTQEK